jgi:hypothetical protein
MPMTTRFFVVDADDDADDDAEDDAEDVDGF